MILNGVGDHVQCENSAAAAITPEGCMNQQQQQPPPVVVMCGGCSLPIMDRYLMNVLDKPWHSDCVRCCDCGAALTDKCYSRDGRLFCKDDFYRRFSTRCFGCGEAILPKELLRKVKKQLFHLSCFVCSVCGKQLATGDQLYVTPDNKLICRHDYFTIREESKEPECGESCEESGHSSCSMSPPQFAHGAPIADQAECIVQPDSSTAAGDPVSGQMLDTEVKQEAEFGELTPCGDLEKHIPELEQSAELPGADRFLKPENFHMKQEPQPAATATAGSPALECHNDSSDKQEGYTSDDAGGENSDDEKYDDEAGQSDDNKSEFDENELLKSPKAGCDEDVMEKTKTQVGSKRRGPRTTIKAKQLETLKSAFAATPKPTRHIREQLAQETGLNMRVIQVWFQNRRSKERRMKQLNALGARRAAFFQRRMRGPFDTLPHAADFLGGHGGGGPGLNFFPHQDLPGSEFFAMNQPPFSYDFFPGVHGSAPPPPPPGGHMSMDNNGDFNPGANGSAADALRLSSELVAAANFMSHCPPAPPPTEDTLSLSGLGNPHLNIATSDIVLPPSDRFLTSFAKSRGFLCEGEPTNNVW